MKRMISRETELKKKIEELYLKEKKTPREISEKLGIPLEVVECLIKFFRLSKSKEIIKKTLEMKEELGKERTREECLKEFRGLKKELRRTPMLLELPKLGYEGLKRDILKLWGSYSDFLLEGKLGKPRPRKGSKLPENFQRLASEAAINYYQKGKWSRSELKIKRILEEEMGLQENTDFWHNFKVKSPLGSYFELDFYLPRWRLVIEADSFWHDLGESKARDEFRDLWIREKLNCETLRFDKFNQRALVQVKRILREKLKEEKTNA